MRAKPRARLCNDLDDDCDGSADESPEVLWCQDRDDDGFGDPGAGVHTCDRPSGFSEDCTDCDDMEIAVNAGMAEVPGDGVDNDCDGEAL